MPDILDGMSFDAERANIDKLRAAFPDCFAEGKLDIHKLLSLCGEYADEEFEKYSFTWKGKAECLRLAQKRSTGTLRPCPAESVNWDATRNLYIEEDFKKLDEAGGIYWTRGGEEQPYGKIYLSDSAGQIPSDFWGIEFGTNQRASVEVEKLFGKRVFDFPKPVSLVSILVNLGAPNGNDIILDFFSGSATTAHAVMQLNAEDGGNRQFIMVQLPEVCDEKSEAYKAGFRNICEIGKERIRRAGAKLLGEVEQRNSQRRIGEDATPPPDVGFRVFKLDASNLKTWDSTPIEGDRDEQLAILHARMREMIHRIKPDRSALDMVFEVMLKMGVPLSSPVTTLDIHGKTVYGVGEDTLLLISLAPSLTAEDIEVMAGYAPGKVIISQESFDTNSDSATAYYILRDRKIDLKLL